MIRPIFNVSQDDSFIYIEAKVKYVKISDFEYFIGKSAYKYPLAKRKVSDSPAIYHHILFLPE